MDCSRWLFGNWLGWEGPCCEKSETRTEAVKVKMRDGGHPEEGGFPLGRLRLTIQAKIETILTRPEFICENLPSTLIDPPIKDLGPNERVVCMLVRREGHNGTIYVQQFFG